MSTVKIYGIVNPLNNHMIYVGASMYPQQRFNSHKFGSEWKPHTAKYKEVRKLYLAKIEPLLIILDECSRDIAKEREDFWINHYIELGHIKRQNKSSYCIAKQRSYRLNTIVYND